MLAARRMMIQRAPKNLQVFQDGTLVREFNIASPFLTGTKVGKAQAGDYDSTHVVWDDFNSVLGTPIADTYNRADNPTSLGTPSDGGPAWTLTPHIQWGIASNRAYQSSNSSGILDRFGGSSYTAAYRDSGSVACDVTFKFGITGTTVTTPGLAFAYDGGVGVNGNAYLVTVRGTSGSIRKATPSGDNTLDTFTISDISTTISTFRVVFTP